MLGWTGWTGCAVLCCWYAIGTIEGRRGGSRKWHVREPSFDWQLRLATTRQESIPLIDKNITPPLHDLSHTHTFTMQSTRAFNMLRQRAAPVFRAQQPVRGLRLQSSPKMRSPAPVSDRKEGRPTQ